MSAAHGRPKHARTAVRRTKDEGSPMSPPAPHEAATDLIHRSIEQCGLGLGLVGLARLRVAQIHGCDARIDAQFLSLIDAGFSIEKLVRVSDWREAGTALPPQERAVLAWAEALAQRGTTPAPEALRQEVLTLIGQEALVGLSLAIGLENALSQSIQMPAQAGHRLQPHPRRKDQP